MTPLPQNRMGGFTAYGSTSYCSKEINFAQCMAKDLAASGVRVNSVCPGMVKTPLNKSVWQAWHDQQPAEKSLSYEEWALVGKNGIEARKAASLPGGHPW